MTNERFLNLTYELHHNTTIYHYSVTMKLTMKYLKKVQRLKRFFPGFLKVTAKVKKTKRPDAKVKKKDFSIQKVVCHGLSNLISCLDDIIVMLRSDWPTPARRHSSRLACIRGTIYNYRCWDALGTLAAVLSLCETLCS